MTFADKALLHKRPRSIHRGVSFPRRQKYYPSPVDWREEILYFLLVDRFSDGEEKNRPLLDRCNLQEARSSQPNDEPWRWDLWAESGANRFQGGTLKGVISKLSYLKNLGITAIWLSPVFKQRVHEDSYHGYGVQDFLEVDPHFGDRSDLVDLVAKAHDEGMRIVLDVIFNHSGSNWLYPPGTPGGIYMPVYNTSQYDFGFWRGDIGQSIDAIQGEDDGVWPVELQDANHYTRAGMGSLDVGDINDSNAEHKRTDFVILRDFRLDRISVLNDLASCYKYWIALTDCDGFRIDTLKHVSLEEARNFCGAIKEFAATLGKDNFFLVGEIAGGDFNEDRYLDVLDRNLNAALDIGQMRLSLNSLAKGLAIPADYFDGFDPGNASMGSHRNIGNRHVSILDDHDHVFGQKLRFSSQAANEHQVVGGVALQLLTLGIPCIYYGTEQAFAGPEPSQRQWLPQWGSSDRYLREAMFGPQHPRKKGAEGLSPSYSGIDQNMPGFGPFGTAGYHCFDEKNPIYRRISALSALRKDYPVLCHGRQYLRPISILGLQFDVYGPGEIIAWSRILDDEEALCIFNSHGIEVRGADILVDASLNPAGSQLTVILNTAQYGDQLNVDKLDVDKTDMDKPNIGRQAPRRSDTAYKVGSKIPILRTAEGKAFIEIRDIPPSEVLVLMNHPEKEEGSVYPDE
jgi:glycosidase